MYVCWLIEKLLNHNCFVLLLLLTCKQVGKTFEEKCIFHVDTCTDNPVLKVVHIQ